MRFFRKIENFLLDFVNEKRGNVAIIFATAMLPMAVLVGGGLDYAQAVKSKSQATTALDAAMLAVMLKYSNDDTIDYQKVVTDHIKKNLIETDKRLRGVEFTVGTVTISDDGEMNGSITGTVPTSFLKLAHFEQLEFTVNSSVMVGGASLEVALVLDNTGSMAGDKIEALKMAATDLVEALMPENNNGKVKFGLVPFADYVNIGKEHRDESGLDIPDDYFYTPTGQNCWNEYPDSTEQCTNNPYQGTCYNDGVPYTCQKNNWTCTGDKGDPVEHCEDRNQQHWKWRGCMASRGHDLNVRDDGYDTGVPGLMMNWNLCKNIAPITRLTNIKGQITSGLAQMKSKRQTYIPSGLAWGWRLLSSEAPFTDGAPYTDEAVKKVIVLMTDGANTRSTRHWKNTWNWGVAKHHEGEVWGHDKSGSDATAEANAYTSELCNNIKAKSIMVYTIGFEIEADSDIENLMKACAGNGGQYFDADDSTELADAFRQIGLALLNLRLSK